MRALVLAAGHGTRLGALTEHLPKPLLPIGGRPLLELTLQSLSSHGVDAVAINLHHCAQKIRDGLGDGARLGTRIVYSEEPQLLGTAGTLASLRGFLGESSPFIVVYGDVLTDVDYGRLVTAHRAHGGVMTVLVGITDRPTEVGLIGCDPAGRIVRFHEKPSASEVFSSLYSAGVLVCEPAVLADIPPDRPYDIGRQLMPRLLEAGRPVYAESLLADEYLIDIGTPAAYERAQREWGARPKTRSGQTAS